MHKEDLIKKLAKKNRRPRQFYRDALHEMLEAIQSQLAEGKTVTLTGFGTFYNSTHRGGKGMSFKTKKPTEYKATFRPGNILKQAVRRKKGIFRR